MNYSPIISYKVIIMDIYEDFKLLAQIVPYSQNYIANEIGQKRPNLSSFLTGKRELPEESKIKLRQIIGLRVDGKLDPNRIHYWKVKGGEIDLIQQAISRFFPKPRIIGPAIWQEGYWIEPVVPITNSSFSQIVIIKQKVDIVEGIVRIFSDRTVSPKSIEGAQWMHGFNDYEDYSITIPKETYEQLVSNKLNPSDLFDMINTYFHPYYIWTWEKIEKCGVTPKEVADLFNCKQSA